VRQRLQTSRPKTGTTAQKRPKAAIRASNPFSVTIFLLPHVLLDILVLLLQEDLRYLQKADMSAEAQAAATLEAVFNQRFHGISSYIVFNYYGFQATLLADNRRV
jgi:hypothetical protein